MTTVPVVCIALMGIVLFVLGANVTRHRAIRAGTGNQAPTDPADRMHIAQRRTWERQRVRPHPRRTIVVCSFLTDGWWLTLWPSPHWSAGGLHAFGMLTAKTLAAHGPVRDIGAMGTYLTGVLLGVTALVAL